MEIFAQRLTNHLASHPKTTLTIVAHSMGSIVANEFIRRHGGTTAHFRNCLHGGGLTGFVPVWEGPFTDNNQRAAPTNVTNTLADLVVTSVEAPATAFSGDAIDVKWTVKNQGAGAVWSGTQRWVDYVYVTLDEKFDADRAFLAGSAVHIANAPLQPGESYAATAKVALPEGIEGKRFIHVFTDISISRDGKPGFGGVGPDGYPTWPQTFRERVWEGPTKENNRGTPTSVSVTYREPDLQVTALTIANEARSGDNAAIQFTVTNVDSPRARATRVNVWQDVVYISKDRALDAYDAMLGSFTNQGALAPGGKYSVSDEFRLPDNIGGDFFILVYTDSPVGPAPGSENALPYPADEGPPRLGGSGMGKVHEFADEGNNTAVAAIKVTKVPPPDLKPTQVVIPQKAIVGRGFELTFEVTNTGAGVVPDRQNKWTDYVFLSRDPLLDARGDHFVGQFDHLGALNPGQSYSDTRTWNIPGDLIGPYYVIVLTDVSDGVHPRGAVLEASESNNATASAVPMLIELPPPSDLQVDEINVPASAFAGETVTITWKVSNHGADPASGRWADSAYLSRDATWDLGDKRIGTLQYDFQTLAQGQGYTATLTARFPVGLPDNYHVIVRADIFDDINEAQNNANNTTASADSIVLSVKILTLGIPADDSLSPGEELLYRVQVGAGETLAIDLDSKNDAGANELYARYEALPNSINYDAVYPGHLIADQTVTVPRTQAGFYYILARGQSGPADSPVRLNARILPFGITDITPDAGGDSRYVTLKITGAKFDPAATVKLTRPQFAEFAPVNYQVVNATTIMATFDFRDAPHGLYDVQVANPDGKTSILPYRYLIESALPLDLTVGLGGPSTIPIGLTGTAPALYGVSISSLTNVDTPYVHIEFGVPRVPNKSGVIPGEALTFSTDLHGTPSVSGVDWDDLDPVINLKGVLTASGFAYDFIARGFGAQSFIVEVYPELKRLLKENPDFFKGLSDFQKLDLAFKFYIYAAATPMTAQEYVDFQRQQALEVRDKILADPDAPQSIKVAATDAQTWGDLYLASLTDAGLLRPQDTPPEIRQQTKFVGAVTALAAGMLDNDSGQPVISTGDLKPFFDLVRKWLGHDPTAYGSSAIPAATQFDLKLSNRTHFEAFVISVGTDDLVEAQTNVVAVPDPNFADFFGIAGTRSSLVHITGPSGEGNANFVPVGLGLPYSISFQNPTNAAAAIPELRVIQQLDKNLDVRTFTLSDFQLGDLAIHLPAGRGSFTGEFDFVKERGYVLQVTAGVDVVSGIATWLLRAIDPETGLLVTDPKVGLLQPGATGQVGYTIKAKSESKTGDPISATARVFYGTTAPLDSNVVTNTIDAVVPTTTFAVEDVGNNSFKVTWSAQDDGLGAGLKDSTVYVSLDGGPFVAFLANTTDTSLMFGAPAGDTPTFLVLSSDAAGNAENAPPGALVPPYDLTINLGTLPTAPETVSEELPSAPVVDKPATNPLFVQALLQTPGRQSTAQPSAFARVFEPFTVAAFASNLPQSGAGIGPLGIAFTPDGKNVLVSAGLGRNNLWRFNLSGGHALTPLATLDVPIYDMTFDSNGLLWATTGGGPLIQLDPDTGAILQRFGDGINLGLAADPTSSKLYVSTHHGVDVFDTTTHKFTPFSNTRVDGLALAPDGTLWGVAWPKGGQVLSFDNRGRAQVVLKLEQPADGLAFGRPGTVLDNLLFVTNADAGSLTMADLLSLKTVEVAGGGSRGDFAHVGLDGRLYVTQSDQVSVFSPVVAPRVIATLPVPGAGISPIVNRASVTFNVDMLAGQTTPANAVTNPANYQLKNMGTGQSVAIGLATYDAPNRTVQLSFESLPTDEYELTVTTGVQSDFGVPLEQPYTTRFVVLQDLTNQLVPQFSDTRLNRGEGTVSFDVRVTNSLSFNLAAPVRVIFAGLATRNPDTAVASLQSTSGSVSGISILGADGLTEDGHPYIDLAPTPAGLNGRRASISMAKRRSISSPATVRTKPAVASRSMS